MCARYYPRRGGAIPPALAQGNNLFPMVPMRNKLQIAIGDATTSLTSADNDGEVVDLDLQFEDNEVMDLWMMKWTLTYTERPAADLGDNSIDAKIALFEDPDKADTTDIGSENVIENDSSLIHWEQWRYHIDQGATQSSNNNDLTKVHIFTFPQPYTVARNIKLILQANATLVANDFDSIDLVSEIWGRRRNAKQDEFINIVYRQRF